MKIRNFSFGSIEIDGATYKDDVVIAGGTVYKRDKAQSRKFRGEYGHTPLSLEENIPWNCARLIVGTGTDGKLPVRPEVRQEAERRNVELVVEPTARAIASLLHAVPGTANAILHITC